MKRKRRNFNKFEIKDNYVIGYTSNTNEKFYFDLEDYERVKEHCWNQSDNGYIRTSIRENGKKHTVFLHRFVLNITDKKQLVDHKDRNKTNCRKSNLRLASSSQNLINQGINPRNKTGYTGVILTWGKHKKKHKYVSFIVINKKTIYLCWSNDIEECLIARLKAEKEYYGEFAPQQHLFKQYNIE